jgi:NADH:ubiquinone oxidoreductase subunit 5 (subunit L)/multisubunit Na+/H+ antiporter MnhA subunit
MYSLILLFPLFGFLCAGLGGFYFGREGVSLLVCVGQICSLFSVFLALYEVIYCKSVVFLPLWHWIILDDFFIRFGLLFDNLTCVMLLIIMLISTCVHFYSIGYMSEDPYLVRFLGYLSLFNFFMLFLVCADNFLQMFIGWEGVGLCSYLLINF